MSGEVLAIGPYSKDLLPLLSKPGDYYAAMNSESIVLEPLFYDVGRRGSMSTRALADALSVEPWNFSTHSVRFENVNIEALRELVGEAETHKFQELARRGFRFHFRPNG